MEGREGVYMMVISITVNETHNYAYLSVQPVLIVAFQDAIHC